MIIQKAMEEVQGILSKNYDFQARLVEPRGGYGDLAFACFEHARANKKDPRDDASKIAKSLPKMHYFEHAEALNGFVNLHYSQAFYEESLTAINENCGKTDYGKNKLVIVEHSSPNVGKPMHIGHLRCTILGDAIANILDKTGYRVVRSNYLCEAGKQVALLLAAIDEQKEKPKNEKELAELYASASGNPLMEEKAKEKLELMESGDAATLKQLRGVRALSVQPLRDNYARLGVEFDEELYDTDFVDKAKEIAGEAISKKVAVKEETGETVVKLEPAMPNYVLLRSNNTTLYATRDLALADYRFEKHSFDECVYVTASDQNMHFKQFFKTLELLGRGYASRLRHVGYGLLSLPGGKMSTREGRVILVDEFLDKAVSAAEKEVRARQEYSNEEIAGIAEAVALGATKFAVLKVGSEKNIVFNASKVTKFEGHTGAFLQYSVVRCKGILDKAGSFDSDYAGPFNEFEENLIERLAYYQRALNQSSRNLAPHSLCEYLLELADDYSSFYANCKVLKSKEQAKRLTLVKATLFVLEDGLRALGIRAPDKM